MNKVINVEENVSLANKAKQILKGVKLPLVALAIITTLSGCSNNNEQKGYISPKPIEKTGDPFEDAYLEVISEYPEEEFEEENWEYSKFTDVNNANQLSNRVEEIYYSINTRNNILYTKNEIKDLILFANFDSIPENERPKYESIEEVNYYAQNIALIAQKIGITGFLTENSKDMEILTVFQKYSDDLLTSDKNLKTRTEIAMDFNELTANVHRVHNYYQEATISGLAISAAIYNEAGKAVDKLTAGKLWGPIYGEEVEIDGSYGFICVEELRKVMDYDFYTTMDVIVKSDNPGLVEGQERYSYEESEGITFNGDTFEYDATDDKDFIMKRDKMLESGKYVKVELTYTNYSNSLSFLGLVDPKISEKYMILSR